MVLYVGLINLGYKPCPANGILVSRPGQSEVACGGRPPTPWLVIGGAALLLSIVGFVTALRRN
jgi:hypothetical protein